LYAGKETVASPSDQIADLLRAYTDKKSSMDMSGSFHSFNAGGGEDFEDGSLSSLGDLFGSDERHLSLFDSGDAGSLEPRYLYMFLYIYVK
jgi:hypothetical protein